MHTFGSLPETASSLKLTWGEHSKTGVCRTPPPWARSRRFALAKGWTAWWWPCLCRAMVSDSSASSQLPPPSPPRPLPFGGDDADKEGRRNAGVPSVARTREAELVGDAQADTRLVPRPSTALAGAATGGGGGIGNGTVDSADARPTSAPPSWAISGVPGSEAEGMHAPLEAPIVDRSDSLVGQVCVCVCVRVCVRACVRACVMLKRALW